MLTAQNLSKNYGIEPILTDLSFSINAGERIGLVRPNGCFTFLDYAAGKT